MNPPLYKEKKKKECRGSKSVRFHTSEELKWHLFIFVSCVIFFHSPCLCLIHLVSLSTCCLPVALNASLYFHFAAPALTIVNISWRKIKIFNFSSRSIMLIEINISFGKSLFYSEKFFFPFCGCNQSGIHEKCSVLFDFYC